MEAERSGSNLDKPGVIGELGFLSAEELACMLGLGVRTLANWRSARTGPPWVRLHSRLIAYPRDAFQKWARAQIVGNETKPTLTGARRNRGR